MQLDLLKLYDNVKVPKFLSRTSFLPENNLLIYEKNEESDTAEVFFLIRAYKGECVSMVAAVYIKRRIRINVLFN